MILPESLLFVYEFRVILIESNLMLRVYQSSIFFALAKWMILFIPAGVFRSQSPQDCSLSLSCLLEGVLNQPDAENDRWISILIELEFDRYPREGR